MQEKFDGRRLLVRKLHGRVTGINRRGLETGLPAKIVRSASWLLGDFIIDGEAVDDILHAFDLLEIDDEDLRNRPYRERLDRLNRLLDRHEQGNISLVHTAFRKGEKRRLFDRLRKFEREGMVFKRLDSPYVPGRPASGGTQLKYKFRKSASCMVLKRNIGRRSVALGILSGDDLIKCGNVTIPSNHNVPSRGTVVEVRYLYAYPDSKALYQPVYLGTREELKEHGG